MRRFKLCSPQREPAASRELDLNGNEVSILCRYLSVAEMPGPLNFSGSFLQVIESEQVRFAPAAEFQRAEISITGCYGSLWPSRWRGLLLGVPQLMISSSRIFIGLKL